MKTRTVLFLVAIAGGCALAQALLTTRLLAPVFGAGPMQRSTALVMALAGALLGLSRAAARGARGTANRLVPASLSWPLALAALDVIAICWLVPVVRAWLESAAHDARQLYALTVLISALVCAPPSFLAAMVVASVAAARARSHQGGSRNGAGAHEGAGNHARGDAVGSVGLGRAWSEATIVLVAAAAIAATLVQRLLPGLGARRLLLVTAGLQLLAAAVAALTTRPGRATRRERGILALILLGLGGVAASWNATELRPVAQQGLLAVRDSRYAEICVVLKDNEMLLVLDGDVRARRLMADLDPTDDYVIAMGLAHRVFAKPGEALLIGVGAGSLVRAFCEKGWSMEVVERDAAVVATARQFFGLDADHAHVVVADPRQYLRESQRSFDLILIDATGGCSIPGNLLTRSAIALVASHLKPGAVLALRVQTQGWDDPMLSSLAATLAPDFPNLLALPTAEPPDTLGNMVLLASVREMTFSRELLEQPHDFLAYPYQHWAVVEQNHAWDNQFVPPARGAHPLTGGRAVDRWAEVIERRIRAQLAKSMPLFGTQ
jgi:hypothetical protein